MEVSGKIKWLDETKTYGNNGFRKREVVITTEEQYPQHILVEFIQDKCDLLNAFEMGQNVKIGINLRGREWVNPQGRPSILTPFRDGVLKLLQHPQILRCLPYLLLLLLNLQMTLQMGPTMICLSNLLG